MSTQNIRNSATGQMGYAIPGQPLPDGWEVISAAPQMAATPVATPVAAPVGDVFKDFSYSGNPELDTAVETGLTTARNSTAPIDESAIRSAAINQFQKEIDAVNSIYAEKRVEAQNQGLSRLGSARAAGARAGILGSDFGNAQNDEVEKANNSILASLDAEKLAKVEAITNSASQTAAAEIAAKRAAQSKGVDDYIKFLGAKTERKAANTKAIAASILSQKIDPMKDLDPNMLKEIAAKNALTTDEILTEYATQKKVQDAAELEAEKKRSDMLKDSYQTVNEGDQIYKRNADGTLTLLGKNPKTYAPSSTSGVTPGSDNQFASDLDAIIGNTLATIPTKFGQSTFQNQISRSRNDADKISTVASVVLKNAPAEVKTDFTNQTVGIKNIDKAIALLDKGTQTGLVKDGTQYVFNLFGKDADPNLAAVKAYIISAVQPYRNSITGAAWGDQEDGEYQQLFGSTKFSPTELKDRLERVKEIMKNKSAEGLNVYVNPLGTYDNYFQQNQGGNFTTAPDGTQIEIID